MAASTRIPYSASSLGGAHVTAAARYLILAKQELDHAVDLAASVTVFGTTTANLEGSTEFNVEAGKGATFYSAITGLQSALNTNITDAQLSDLEQG